MSYRPVGRKCPECGCTEYRKVKADAIVAFTDDRKCLACGTRYAPPTPAWAAVLFMVLGVLITGTGIVTAAYFAFREINAAEAVKSWLYGGIMIVFGIACVIHGVRSLRQGREDGRQSSAGLPPPPPRPEA
jgi:hypothetical protein